MVCRYDRFKSIQGVDVPFCYGFYNFDPLTGPIMIGVVLEDLVFATTDLHTYTVRSRKMQSDHKEHMKFIDRMVGIFFSLWELCSSDTDY